MGDDTHNHSEKQTGCDFPRQTSGMRQVWILNHYAQEPGGAGGTRHFHFAEHLGNLGWQATLFAASVELNSGRQRLSDNEIQRRERIGDASFVWIRTPSYRGNGGGRMLNMLVYTWRMLMPRTVKGLTKPDVIIGSSVHPFAAFAGAILARRHRVPFIFEVRDLWPQTLVDMGRLKEGAILTWALRRLETWLYRRAMRIIVLLPLASEYIVRLGIPRERVVWISNGVELSTFPSSDLPPRAPDEPFTLMYFGAHGQANAIDNILRAMQCLQNRRLARTVHLRIIGDGALKPHLQAMAQDMSLGNVSFEPPVAKKHIPALAASADAFVIAVLDLPELYRYGISMNKLFDYLAAQRPIVMASNAGNSPVLDAGAGYCVAADQPKLLADAIQQIAELPETTRAAMGRAGRKYVETHFGFQQLASDLATVLNDSVKAKP